MWSSWIILPLLASSNVLALPLIDITGELGTLQRRAEAQPQQSFPLAELQEDGKYLQTPEASNQCLEKYMLGGKKISFVDAVDECRRRHGTRPVMSDELRTKMQVHANARAKQWLGQVPSNALQGKRGDAIRKELEAHDGDIETEYGVRPTRHRGGHVKDESDMRISSSASNYAQMVSRPSINNFAKSVSTRVQSLQDLAANPNNFRVQVNPLQMLGSIKLPTTGVRPTFKMPMVVG